ncbi:hypothetical protein DFJ74DRAFT_708296 [Hyaloraphidium curvatum]|nr:hypothetical protein DFJ74DRAFT_708296 [Hyaloraphidium curvatum]
MSGRLWAAIPDGATEVPFEDLAALTDVFGNPAVWAGGERFPTMDFQLQIRNLPVPTDAPFQMRSWRGATTRGRTDWQCEIWSSDGERLLAVTRQSNIVVSTEAWSTAGGSKRAKI